MSIELSGLLEQAFFIDEAQHGSIAIERALETFEQQKHIGTRLVEVVAPEKPDEQWLRERLVGPLIYFCESEGDPVPTCAGVVVALYVGNDFYALTAEKVIKWASEQLGLGVEQLRAQYGTHELETSLRA